MGSIWLVFCDCCFHSICLLMDNDKRFMEASWWERLTEWETVSCSDGWGHVQLIFNPIFYWWVGLCSLPVSWPEAKNEDNEDLQNVPWRHCCIQWPRPCNRPLPTHASFGDSWTLMGSLGQSPYRESDLGRPDSLWGYYSFSCFLVCTSFVCVLQESVSPVLCKFCWFSGGVIGNLL